ncbi:MAG TPA: cytochrome c oxidase subunit II [Caldimonas sp.]|nr:cytochrome c oxidase subunit II [Caldimonas sp.]
MRARAPDRVRSRAAWCARALAFLLLLVVGGVAWAIASSPVETGPHEVLAPAGVQADRIGQLWNLFLAITTLVTLAVFAVFAFVLWRTPRAEADAPADLSSLGRHEAGAYRSVVGAVAVSIALLLVLLAASVWTDRALARMTLADALNIQVTGHQWWWEARYGPAANEPVSNQFITANELHVPVGRPVIVTLTGADVIHSLWVPNLAGKKDLIPGRTAKLEFRADRPGVYRGQCAEFCGYQHGYMGFQVFADAPADYAAWEARQRLETGTPTDATLQHGEQVFLGSTCIMCHTVNGTTAQANFGPDLTHVGGRTTLAAGTLRNTPQDLKRWISDPQKIKPGVNMPASTLSDADLDALVAWLGSLK